METKLDSRQGQFPASFPDTFKDFFAMMSEDEDHLDLFSNLLEDKIIPRSNRRNQRRCGGSLRCPTTSNNNVGRSNSFRFNRPNNNTTNTSSCNSTSSGYCQHIKYCCLHQKHYSQNFIDFGYSSPSNDDEEGDDDGNNCDSIKKTKQKAKSRPSLIDRTLDCDSCEESDTMSTSSSTTTIPYGSGTARHHHHHHQHHSRRQQQQQQQQQQLEREKIQTSQRHTQRKGSGGGGGGTGGVLGICVIDNNSGTGGGVKSGFHSKDSLPRIGLRESISGIVCGPGSSSNAGMTGGNGGSGAISAAVSSCNISCTNIGRNVNTLYGDMNTSSISSSTGAMTKCFSDKLTPGPLRPNTLRGQKSPVLNRRRSSSIAATLLTSDNKIFRNADDISPWGHTIPHSNTRERLSHAKTPVNPINIHPPTMKSSTGSGVLSFKQAMSGAVSPQFTPSSSIIGIHGAGNTSSSNNSAITNTTGVTSATTSRAVTPTSTSGQMPQFTSKVESVLDNSVTAIPYQINSKQRLRTSSMPAESRKPRLADTRRAAIHCADMDIEYYRLRSFSITSHGVCNLGDSMRSRRSRSINSVTSTGTSNSGRDRHNSNASADITLENYTGDCSATSIPAYKIAILGASGVGKTALTYQFTTSDYICAYDLSLDDDYGQKTVSVLLDGIETDLEIIDHPACEMSTEAFCSTYNIDLFVVVYSVVDRNSFKTAEKILHYLKDNEMLLTRGAILVGNKTDLERHREVTRQSGRRLAKEIACKFIETSSGLDHNVNELLVGIVAQVKLNPQRLHNLTEKERQRVNLQAALQKHRRLELPSKKIIKQRSICTDSEDISSPFHVSNSSSLTTDTLTSSSTTAATNLTNATTTTTTIIATNKKSGPIKKITKRALNLESILKVGESEIDDEDDDGYKPDFTRRQRDRKISSNISKTAAEIQSTTSRSASNSPKSRNSYDHNKKSQYSQQQQPQQQHQIKHQQKQQQQQQNSNQQYKNNIMTNLVDDSSSNNSSYKEKSISKFSNRTRVFLTSVLKFKKNLNVKRRNSSSCSDLFVI